jgi:hypothetical protein
MSRTTRGALGAAITATVVLSGAAVLGQDASPPAASPGSERGPYQATLRSGDCDAPGEIAAVLADPMTGVSTDPGTPVVSLGPTPEQPVRVSESEVPVPLTDIAERGHAVVVDDPVAGSIVACGPVGGPALAEDRLPVALTGPDGAPVGIALLSALGIEATNVLVLLALPGERFEQPDESPAPSTSPDADGFVEPDPDEPGPDPDPEIDPREDSGDDVSG